MPRTWISTYLLTRQGPDPAPLEQPGAGVAAVILEVEVLDLAVSPVGGGVLAVEGVPPHPHADVGGHGDDRATAACTTPASPVTDLQHV